MRRIAHAWYGSAFYVSKYEQCLRQNHNFRYGDREGRFAGGDGMLRHRRNRFAPFYRQIYIDVYVIIKFGVSINAVAESLKESVKYRVEKFTGMIVDTVNVNVIGVKL